MKIKTIFSLAIFCSSVLLLQLKSQTPTRAWISGTNLFNSQANYGTKGNFSTTNFAGARENSMSWTDSNNNLWMFGGHGYTTTSTQGYLNDLWQYNPTTNQWAWMHGSTTPGDPGNFEMKGF